MMRSSYQIRIAEPARDFAKLAPFLSQIWDEPVTPQDLHEWESQMPAGKIRRRWVGYDGAALIGYAIAQHEAWMADGRFSIDIAVHEAHRRQGVGARLYETAQAFVEPYNIQQLDCEVKDNDPASRRFAEKRGFVIDRHVFESVIDLRTFAETSVTDYIVDIEAAGIRITTLAGEGDTEAARRKLHALNRAVALDDPGSSGGFLDFDGLNELFNTASWFVPEGQFLAVAGDAYVGLSAVGYFRNDNSMYNLITGVDRAYRGRKIAQALKLSTIRFARAYGADTIKTHNDSKNEPMLAINRKLGYVPQIGKFRLKADYQAVLDNEKRDTD